MLNKHILRLALLLALISILSACAGQLALIQDEPAGAATQAASLTIYSGRNENLVGLLSDSSLPRPALKSKRATATRPKWRLRFWRRARLWPADVFFGQDAGAVGACWPGWAGAGCPARRCSLQQVDAHFRDGDGRWVGASGRARCGLQQRSAAGVAAGYSGPDRAVVAGQGRLGAQQRQLPGFCDSAAGAGR